MLTIAVISFMVLYKIEVHGLPFLMCSVRFVLCVAVVHACELRCLGFLISLEQMNVQLK